VDQTRSSLEGLSQYISAHAAKSKSEWPRITIPNFEAVVKSRRELAGAEAIAFCPFVSMEDLQDWNEYSSDHSWYEESNDFLAELQTRSGLSNESTINGIYRVRFTPDFVVTYYHGNETFKKVPMAPLWQISPTSLNDGLINFDVMSEDSPFISYINSYESLMQSREIAISAVKSNEFINVLMSEEEHDAFHVEYRGNSEELELGFSHDHPHSRMLTPIFEKASGKGKIMGFLTAWIGWDTFVGNLLPEGANGVYAVLQNTCNQSFTYVINGPSALYLGEGDLHDEAYDNLLEVVDLAKLFHDRKTPVDENDCFYSFYLYPSEETEAPFMTPLPRNVTMLAALTFAVMIATFFMYERFVQSKNRKVTIAAAKASKIVTSLFPDNIRERMYNEQDVRKKSESEGTTIHDFFPMRSTVSECSDDDLAMYESEPIADLFTATTVMFADIAGFTAWSADRDPTQVFILLETVYGAFDRWARKMKVFKVETIGDCYVAVTGVPDLRHDHAVVMVKFALKCLKDMQTTVQNLEDTLGEGTSRLTLRIGLHSGPVTAGVLRGEKSRFQLFGDTINTASRMESTGEQGRIQVSQETADLLIEGDKEAWIFPREDKVIAKGKGEMDTYWVRAPTDSVTS